MKLFRLFYNAMVSRHWLIFLFVGLLCSCDCAYVQPHKGVEGFGHSSFRFLDTVPINDSTYVVNVVYMYSSGIAAVKVAEFTK